MKLISFFVLLNLLYSPMISRADKEIKMADFIGINSNVASYDEKYLTDLAKCAKWMREYHSWGHYEVADNYYKWDNITTYPQGYTWPDHNKFMDQCHQLGINVLIDVLNKPEWAGTSRGAYSTGDGSKASDYLDKLEFIGQLVARYGSRKIDKSKLETADKVTGLNYIRYYEDDNEPDYWWETPQWPAEKYAVYCNAVHDGFGVDTSDDYPLLGIKSVDSTAVHVLAGLAKNNTTYIQKILTSSKGRVPFDVINIHTYCTDDKDGYSPENENYGLEKNLGTFMNWCNATLPGMPVWLTEFGWDTYSTPTSHSYVFAPKEQQANYIIRSYFVALKMGFEKAFMFMDKDPNSTNTLQYSSSGLISDKVSGLSKKPSFYYLSTIQNLLGDAVFKRVVSYRESFGDNEVFCFEFQKVNEKVYVLWTRIKNSKTDSGTTLNYSFNLGYQPGYADLVKLHDKDLDGVKSAIEITNDTIELSLSETPQFVIVPEKSTSSDVKKKNDPELKIYPNPSKNEAQITISNPEFQKIKITVFNLNGRPLEIITEDYMSPGNHNFSFGRNVTPGIYFIHAETQNGGKVKKLIIQ